jgi:hypothetical protein
MYQQESYSNDCCLWNRVGIGVEVSGLKQSTNKLENVGPFCAKFSRDLSPTKSFSNDNREPQTRLDNGFLDSENLQQLHIGFEALVVSAKAY